MAEQTYRFTRSQFEKALRGVLEMLVELRDVHGIPEEFAKGVAINEILQGIDADRELVANDPTERLRLQLPDTTADLLAVCEATIDYWETTGFAECDAGCDCIVDQMRAAIAKAGNAALT